MATIENTRLYRETVSVILEDWDEAAVISRACAYVDDPEKEV